MKQNKLLRLLGLLSSKELKEFEQFLNCAAFNRNQKNKLLFKYLKPFYPTFHQTNKLEKKAIAYHLFFNAANSAKTLRDTMGNLSNLVQKYLVWQELEKHPFEQDFLLLETFKKRQSEYLFNLEFKAIQRKIEQAPFKDMWHYWHQMRFHAMTFFSAYTAKFTKEDKLLQQLMEALDLFYVTAKLRYSTEFFNRFAILKKDEPNIYLLKEAIRLTQNDLFRKNPLFEIYALIIQLLQGNNEILFTPLKKLVFQHLHLASKDEQLAIWLNLINYAIRSGNAGKENYLQEQFDLYLFGLKQAILLEDGILLDIHFLNIITIGCELKQFDFLKKAFIPEYQQNLRKVVRVSALNYAKANIAFAEKDFNTALQYLLSGIENEDASYKLRKYALLLRTYFELLLTTNQDIIEPLENLFQRYEKFLRRTTIFSKAKIQANLNFLKFVKKLYTCHFKQQTTQVNLLKSLAKKTSIICRKWCQEIIEKYY